LEAVVPLYESDLCRARLFARGIKKFDKGAFSKIHLMWISDAPIQDYRQEMSKIEQELKSSGHDVSIETFTTDSGWHKQQEMKLRASSKIESTFYVVLDTKNAPIKDFDLSTFLTADNKGIVTGSRKKADFASPHGKFSHIDQVHGDWYKQAEKTLGHKLPENTMLPFSVSPQVIHTKSARKLVSELESRTGQDLFHVMLGGKGTEFTLYQTYMRTEREFSCYHATATSDPNYTHWRREHYPGHTLESLKKIRDGKDDFKFFGVHRNRHWVEEDIQPVVQTVREIYKSRGLITDDDGWYNDDCVKPGQGHSTVGEKRTLTYDFEAPSAAIAMAASEEGPTATPPAEQATTNETATERAADSKTETVTAGAEPASQIATTTTQM